MATARDNTATSLAHNYQRTQILRPTSITQTMYMSDVWLSLFMHLLREINIRLP